MLCDPFSHCLSPAPFLKLRWWSELRLKNTDVLPGVIGWVLKLVNAVLILQVDLVTCFESAISTVGKLVGFAVDFLIARRIREVCRFCDVFGHVADQPHHLNLVRDEVVIFSTVFTTDGAKSFNYDIIIHLSFNSNGLAFVSEEVFFYRKSEAFCLQLVEPVPEFSEEHFLTVLLQELEVTICST